MNFRMTSLPSRGRRKSLFACNFFLNVFFPRGFPYGAAQPQRLLLTRHLSSQSSSVLPNSNHCAAVHTSQVMGTENPGPVCFKVWHLGHFPIIWITLNFKFSPYRTPSCPHISVSVFIYWSTWGWQGGAGIRCAKSTLIWAENVWCGRICELTPVWGFLTVRWDL